MFSMTDTVTTLEPLLALEQKEAAIFVAILEKETDILVSGVDPEALADVIQEKWYRANALNTLHIERHALLNKLDPTITMDELATTSPSIREAWLTLKPLLELARERNTSNGMLIEQLKKNTEDAMLILRAASGQSSVYTSKGRSTGITSRILATT